jgi:hypothetical protein
VICDHDVIDTTSAIEESENNERIREMKVKRPEYTTSQREFS